MICKVYAVYDKAVAAFMQPFYARSHGEAKRMFVMSAREGSFAHNARDYELFWLSDFNDLTGNFGVEAQDALSVPLRIMAGPEVIAMLGKLAAPKPPQNGVGEDASVGVE